MTENISGKSKTGALPINTIIRTARVDDAACIAVLATQVWLHTYATQGISAAISQYTRTQLIPEKYLALLDDPLARLWVAELDACLIAFAVVKFDAPCPVFAPGSAELQTLYVQEHFVGQGVGRQLLWVAEDMARTQTGLPLWLTVNVHNARAIGFYRRHGYTARGTSDFVMDDQRHENHVFIGGAPTCRSHDSHPQMPWPARP
jgi:GNAT superfamily N-acetyltransferase